MVETTSDLTESGPDFDRLLRANLARVFNERDPARRVKAVEALFVPDPILYEPDKIVTGRQAIADVAGALLDRFGPDFAFTPQEGPAVGHHGVGILRWHAGSAEGPIAVTGTDVAEIVEGRIARLWVMLDARPAP
ncbi:nuclear transport factor 2 family protein [Sphingomonas sp.]|uniref:nuclear transport factor 2 family protein n=1 Tax=Sphingomonas sp. TaxID=28214 RepID=UPI003B3B787F